MLPERPALFLRILPGGRCLTARDRLTGLRGLGVSHGIIVAVGSQIIVTGFGHESVAAPLRENYSIKYLSQNVVWRLDPAMFDPTGLSRESGNPEAQAIKNENVLDRLVLR